MRHKQDEPVRAYLLGTIDDRDAAAMEQKYFVDRDFFLKLRNAETALIEDYLEGRLSRSDKRLFEKKYLEVPDLTRRVEEVRQDFREERSSVSRFRSPLWQLALAGAALSLLLAGAFVYLHAPQRTAVTRSDLPRIVPSVFTLRLTPGLSKGATAESVMTAPGDGADVKLLLEMPGRNSAADYRAHLMAIGADGQRTEVWTSGTLRPEAAPGGGVLPVALAGNLLRPGDYVVQVGLPGGATLESYLFRVRAVP